jgi:hypothetical protein
MFNLKRVLSASRVAFRALRWRPYQAPAVPLVGDPGRPGARVARLSVRPGTPPDRG